MPTAARLVAGFAMAFACAGMVLVLISAYPDERFDRDMVSLMQLFAVIGFLVGWKSLGRKIAVDERNTGIILGVRAAITAALWICFVLGVITVAGNIADAEFQGKEPMEAVFQLVQKTLEYLGFLAHPRVAGIGLFLGVLVGVLTRNTHHRWS